MSNNLYINAVHKLNAISMKNSIYEFCVRKYFFLKVGKLKKSDIFVKLLEVEFLT